MTRVVPALIVLAIVAALAYLFLSALVGGPFERFVELLVSG